MVIVLYKVLADFSYTTIGTVDLDFDTTIAANNGGQVCFNSGITKSGLYNTSTSILTQITDIDFWSPVSIIWTVMAYLSVPIANNFMYPHITIFNIRWPRLSSSGSDPDNLVTGIVDHRELVLFGRKTTSFWFSVGGSDFALARREGAEMEVGVWLLYRWLNLTILYSFR